MLQFLNKCNRLSKNKFSFKRGKLAINPLVSLVDIVVTGLEGQDSMLCVFLDLSIASGCFDHYKKVRIILHWRRPLTVQVRHISANSAQLYASQHKLSISKINSLELCGSSGINSQSDLFFIYFNDVESSMLQGRLLELCPRPSGATKYSGLPIGVISEVSILGDIGMNGRRMRTRVFQQAAAARNSPAVPAAKRDSLATCPTTARFHLRLHFMDGNLSTYLHCR
ncbi:hypothetical protein J6590_094114 [Homalodisca vitripennis]|nr:hypothetical protein J6590_094114 [Homalodisca vitripennis]